MSAVQRRGRQRRGGRIEIVAGLALAMAAILIHQIGLAIPIAYVAKRGLGFWRVVEAIIPVVAGVLLFRWHTRDGCIGWIGFRQSSGLT
jgi:hypothetical protein